MEPLLNKVDIVAVSLLLKDLDFNVVERSCGIFLVCLQIAAVQSTSHLDDVSTNLVKKEILVPYKRNSVNGKYCIQKLF